MRGIEKCTRFFTSRSFDRFEFISVLGSRSQLAPVNKRKRAMCSCESAPKCSDSAGLPPYVAHHHGHPIKERSPSSKSLLLPSRSYSTKMPGEVEVLRFVKLTDNAHAPSKGSELAAGYDLKSAYDYTIPARGKELVKTDIQIQVPQGCYGRVAPRSGLAWKNHIDIGAGVIDADYTGNVGIVMFNHGSEDFQVKAGDRIAQLICEKICYPEIQEVKAVSETTRGAGGFGSTGQS